MSEQIEIQKLVAWLESHPGEPPPAELDSEVVEAVYVLRPDLAPAPRVRVEDIMERIQSGPLTEDPKNPVETLSQPAALPEEDLPSFATEDVPTEIAMVRDFEERPANSPPNRRSIWAGAATISVAALVLFVVLPMDQEYSTSPVTMSEFLEAEAPPESGFKEELLVAEEFLEEAIIEKGAAPDTEPTQQRAAPQRQLESSRKKESRVARSGLLHELSDEIATAGALDDALIGGGDSSGLGSVGSGGLSARGAGGSASGYGSGANSFSEAPPQPTSSYKARTEIDFESVNIEDAIPQSAEAAAEMDASELTEINSARSATRSRRADRPRPRKGASVDESVMVAEADAETNVEPSTAADLDSAKRMSAVSDYDSQWYKAALSVSEAQVIEQAIQSGNISELTSLIPHADYRVGQDMAFRAAVLTYRDGRASSALALIQKGKSRSSANTVFLSVLYNLEGEIHLARGDLAAAEQAFRSSAGLNQARTR